MKEKMNTENLIRNAWLSAIILKTEKEIFCMVRIKETVIVNKTATISNIKIYDQ
jgi:hypothetical protein